ncbi:SH3 domain-containing protein [Ornithinimicrobium sp. W1665]|uniref:SH3 domain-containing protein n=1 Tax=Ornithinimicrobium sp. W1665 TaxID=3416666 RepID=UPI003D6C4F12
MADCESSGNWSINTGNGFYGGLQFWHPTWTGFGGAEFAPYAHQATKLQQITVAQRVLKVQGPNAWPVCSVRAGLTMTNGLAPYGDEAPAPAPTPDPGVQGSWWVSATPGANVRSGPSTSYAVVGAAAKGSKVTGVASNGWVRLADGRGWIALSTLTDKDPGASAPAPTPDPGVQGSWWVSATPGANVRSGPSTSYAVVGAAAKGSKVTGVASNGWVRLADGRGWIALSTLTDKDPGASAPAPTPDPGGQGSWWVSATPGANVRSGPSTSYAVVGAAAKGSKVTGVASNGWVRLADGRGWIALSTLTDRDPGASTPEPDPAPPSAAISWTVTATAGANVRSGPSTSYAVVGGLAHGAQVHGELSTNGWVRLTDGRGWVSGSILKPAGGAASGTDAGTDDAPVAPASDLAPLALDGSMGPLTVKAVQHWVGLPGTGRWDGTTIRAVQAEVGTRVDGAWGPMSQVALQDHIGLSRDGSTYLNHRTVVALQAWLNANVIG